MSKYISGIKNSNISIPPNGTITTNNVSSFPDGSVSLPSITFTSDTNTGIYWISYGIIGFSANATERMRITTTGITVTGLITGNNGLTISSGNTSVTTLSASGTSTLAAVTTTTLGATGLITGSNGLTISSGTSALQALTCTTINASGTSTLAAVTCSTLGATGQISGSSGLTISSGTSALQALTCTTINASGTSTLAAVTCSTLGATGLLTASGNLRIGSSNSNFIAFYGTNGDNPTGFNHTYIGERIYDTSGNNERSELLLFKGNDIPGVAGPDRIRLLAAEHRFDTYSTALADTFDNVGAASSNNRMIITNSGNVGIGNTSPNAPLQFATSTASRKIVLFEGVNDDHQFYGFGVNSATLRYQVSATSASHIFYAGTNTPSSTELFRISGDGASQATGKFTISNNASGATNTGLSFNPSSTTSLTQWDQQNENAPEIYSVFAGDLTLRSYWGVSVNLNSAAINPSGSATSARIANTSSFTINRRAIGAGSGVYNNIFTVNGISGNVGIGTTTPESSLHVVGARNNTTPSKGIHLGEGGTDDYAIDISAAGSTNNSYIDFTYAGQDSRGRILYAHSTNAMTFNTNGINERMRISSSGNIGIGTTNTNALLQLSNAQSNRKIVIYEEANDEHQFHGFGLNSGVLRYQIYATSNSHVFYAATSSSASTELFRIAGSGTTTATGSLVITNSTNTANLETLQLSNSSGIDPNFRLVATKGATTNTDGDVIVRLGLNYTSTANSFIRFHRGSSTTGGFMSFSTNTDIERMRIEGSGEVGIGTSDPQRLLHVNGSPIRVDRDYTSGSGGSMYLVTMNSTTIVGSWNIASTGVTSNPDFTIAYTNASAGGAATRTPFYILGSNGNVGVNVSNPLSALHVGGRMFVDNGVIQRGGTAITATTDLGLYSRTSGNFIRYVTNAADHVWFNTEGANGAGYQEAMRLFNNWFSSGTALRVAGRIIIATTGGTTPGDYGWVISTTYPDTFLENLEFATYDDEGYIVKGYIEEDDNTSYRMNDFTGSHRCKYNIEDPDNKIGLIAISTGEYCTVVKTEETTEVKTGKDAITIFDSLPIVELCTTQNDKRCFGVISGLEDPNQTKRGTGIGFKAAYPMPEGDQRLEINGVGEGAIWVCNINNNIENGDYISSSNVPGYGMKQDSDNLKNYTVAKSTCDVNFEDLKELTQKYQIRFLESSGDIITEEVYLKDTQDRYIAAFIGCTYHCG